MTKLNDRYDFNKSSSFTLDDILMEAGAGQATPGEDSRQPSHLWSLDEIEQLLSLNSIQQPSGETGTEIEEGLESPPSPPSAEIADSAAPETGIPDHKEPPGTFLPLFEETDEPFCPVPLPLSSATEDMPREAKAPPAAEQPGEVPVQASLSEEDRFARLEQVLTPITGMQTPFDPNIDRSSLLGEARENWTPPGDGQPLLGADKYRERFFREPTIKIPIEPQPMRKGQVPLIDKPGLIRKKSDLSATADLEPLPTLIAAEDEIDAAIGQEKTREVGAPDTLLPKQDSPKEPLAKDMVDGQLLLAGFNEAEEPAPVLNEEEAELHLQAVRKEKIKKFKLAAVEESAFPAGEPESLATSIPPDEPEQPDESLASPIGEYASPVQKAPLRGLMRRRAALEKRCAFGAGLFELLLILCGILPQVFSFFRGEGEALIFFSADQKLYSLIHLVLFAGVLLMTLPVIRSGLRALFRLKCNADSGAALAAVFALIQNILYLFFSPGANVEAHLFGAAAGLLLSANMIGKALHAKSIAKNFLFCTQDTPLYTVQKIPDEDDAYEIGRGLLLGDPDVRYSTRTAFPARFRALSEHLEPADRLSVKLVPTVLLLSVAAGIAVAVLNQSVLNGFSALTALFCIAVPAALSLGAALPLFRANQALNAGGAMVSGYAAAQDCGETNAVVFDSSDIFKHGGCNIHGFKSFHGMRMDEAILDAAALVISAGGPLGEIFDSVILGNRRILPPVEDLSYEDRMGLSGWIHGRRILVGNRELLQHHNVELPPRQSEAKYRHDGRQVMYLAVDGLISALFVVSYQADPNVAAHLKNLERKGITILVRTSDPNITDSFVEETFGLPQNCVKVISAQAGALYRKYRSTALQRANAGIVHDGRIQNFLRSVAACATLQSGSKLLTILQTAAAALGAALVGVLCFTSDVTMLGAVQLLLYQLFWMVIVLIIGGSEKF